jgi:hypothetical protein
MSVSPNPYEPPGATSTPPLVANVIIDERSVSVEYDLEMEDQLAWTSYCHDHVTTTRRARRIVSWLLFVVVGLMCVLAAIDPDMRIAWLGGGVMAVIAASFWPAFYRWRIRDQVGKIYREGSSLNIVGPRKLTLTSGYVVFSSPISQTTIRWSGVEQLIRVPTALYLKLASFAAIVVPRRAFSSDAQFDQFCRAAESYRHSADVQHV